VTLVAGVIAWSLIGIGPDAGPDRRVARKDSGWAGSVEGETGSAAAPEAEEAGSGQSDSAGEAASARGAAAMKADGGKADQAGQMAEAGEGAQSEDAAAGTAEAEPSPPPLLARSQARDSSGDAGRAASEVSGSDSGGAASDAASGSVADAAPSVPEMQRDAPPARLPAYLRPGLGPGALAMLERRSPAGGGADEAPEGDAFGGRAEAAERMDAVEAALAQGPGEQDVTELARKLRERPEEADRVQLRIVSRDPERTRRRLRAVIGGAGGGSAGQVFGNTSRKRELEAPETMEEPSERSLFSARGLGPSGEGGGNEPEQPSDAEAGIAVPVDRLGDLIEALRADPAQEALHFSRIGGAPAGSAADGKEKKAYEPWPTLEPDYRRILEQQLAGVEPENHSASGEGGSVPSDDAIRSIDESGSGPAASSAGKDSEGTDPRPRAAETDPSAPAQAQSPRITVRIEAVEQTSDADELAAPSTESSEGDGAATPDRDAEPPREAR
jgi:hypothetical protein